MKSRLNLSTNSMDGVLRDALQISFLGIPSWRKTYFDKVVGLCCQKLHTKNEREIQSTVQDSLFLSRTRRLMTHAVSVYCQAV